jgi:hypothetical protein
MPQFTNPNVPRLLEDVESDLELRLPLKRKLVRYVPHGDEVDLTYEYDDSGLVEAIEAKFPAGIPASTREVRCKRDAQGKWTVTAA